MGGRKTDWRLVRQEVMRLLGGWSQGSWGGWKLLFIPFLQSLFTFQGGEQHICCCQCHLWAALWPQHLRSMVDGWRLSWKVPLLTRSSDIWLPFLLFLCCTISLYRADISHWEGGDFDQVIGLPFQASIFSRNFFYIFSCPKQLNRWPCHWLTN